MSGQYPVTATVTPIFPSAQPTPQTVKNVGLVTVYLGSSSALSVSNGYALGPGSALSWEAGKPLFAITATGASTLSILDNGGSLFDAAAVAAQILISGAPPTDPLSTVYTDVNTVAGGQSYTSPWVNVGGYQSLSIRAAEETATVYTAPLPRRVTLFWSDSNGGIPFAEESFFIADTAGNSFGSLFAFTTYQTAVKDAWLQIKWDSTSRGGTLKSWWTGSYKTVVRPNYTHQSAYATPVAGFTASGDGLDRLASIYSSSFAFQNGVDYYWYPSVSAGAGYRSLTVGSLSAPPAGGSFDAVIYAYGENLVSLYGINRSTGPFPLEDDGPLTIPFTPLAVRMRYNNNTAGTWAAFATMTLTYER